MRAIFARYIGDPVWFDIALAFIIIFIVFLVLLSVYRRMAYGLLQTVRYSRTFSEDGCYQGEDVILTETIFNNSFVPLFRVSVDGYLANQLRLEEYDFDPKKAMQFFSSWFRVIMPFQQIKRRHRIHCTERGYYRLESVDIFFQKNVRHIDAETEIYVYPTLLPAAMKEEPSGVLQGDAYSRRPLIRDPFSLSGIRDYHFGDPFNTINFKATAKRGAVMSLSDLKVNNAEFSTSRAFMVYINFNIDRETTLPTPVYTAMMERALSHAADILRRASESGWRAGFSANCMMLDGRYFTRFPMRSGEGHFIQILRELSRIRPQPGISFANLVDYDLADFLSECEVYVLAYGISEQENEALSRLLRLGNSVNIITLDEKNEDSEENKD